MWQSNKMRYSISTVLLVFLRLSDCREDGMSSEINVATYKRTQLSSYTAFRSAYLTNCKRWHIVEIMCLRHSPRIVIHCSWFPGSTRITDVDHLTEITFTIHYWQSMGSFPLSLSFLPFPSLCPPFSFLLPFSFPSFPVSPSPEGFCPLTQTS